MQVYLAGRSEDLEVIKVLRARLDAHGVTCTARWLNGLIENPKLGALHCLIDIAAADVLVLFNIKKLHRTGTGGRHVETGIALATGKPIVVFGERENVFHHLDQVRCVPSGAPLDALVSEIQAVARSGPGAALSGLRLETEAGA